MLVLFHLNVVDGCESDRYAAHVLPVRWSTVKNVPSSLRLFCARFASAAHSTIFRQRKWRTHTWVRADELCDGRLARAVRARRAHVREHRAEALPERRRVEHHARLRSGSARAAAQGEGGNGTHAERDRFARLLRHRRVGRRRAGRGGREVRQHARVLVDVRLEGDYPVASRE